jgi:hypothetical protein
MRAKTEKAIATTPIIMSKSPILWFLSDCAGFVTETWACGFIPAPQLLQKFSPSGLSVLHFGHLIA